MRLFKTRNVSINNDSDVFEEVEMKSIPTHTTLSFFDKLRNYGYTYINNDIIFDIDYEYPYTGVSHIEDMRMQIRRDDKLNSLLYEII
jgi:hypothetical protein